MKNLFSKYPMLHYTYVLTLIAIACGIFIGSINAWTEPIIEENERLATVESYQAVLNGLSDYTALSIDNDGDTISEKVEGFDASGNLIGYIYKASKTNGYGDMTIVIAIAPDGEILGAEFLTLNQTLYLDRTRSNLALYIGTNITALAPDGDLQGGASFSRTTMIEILTEIATSFENTAEPVNSDPLVAYLGEGYVLETNDNFVAKEHVSSLENITSSTEVPNGYIYTVTGEGDYESYDGTATGSITLKVIMDENNQIDAIYMPEDVYGHTINFMDNNFDYLDAFIGKTLLEISSVVNDNTDLETGASGSRALIDELLEALVSEVTVS
ncbi:hypothetical protein KHQ89_00940 [Mycoplasmatota bacterium]|nr:hypothetical protein KHQ89_00940 [Mycoplasmatota bacterium]